MTISRLRMAKHMLYRRLCLENWSLCQCYKDICHNSQPYHTADMVALVIYRSSAASRTICPGRIV